MQRTLIIVTIISVLIAGGFFWLGAQRQEPTSQIDKQLAEDSGPEQLNEIQVKYGSGGFSPISVTVKNGQKVTFINESGRAMWVASNNHPSHSLYPELNANKDIENGLSYEFTFDKIGRWGYHDHLNSKMSGVVVVE